MSSRIRGKCNYKTITVILLTLILFTYLVVSLGIMRYNNQVPQNDVLFGTDTLRVYHDFFDITGTNHYRTKVHPLILVLLQPFMSIALGLMHHAGTALAVVESITGFCVVFFTNRILDMLVKNKASVILLTLVFAFSFSQLIFVSIPETFIFGGFSTSLCWYYIVKNRDNCASFLERKRQWILVFLGILCFGITITNYMQFVIALLIILYGVDADRKIKIKKFLQINIMTLGLATLLSFVQKIVWRNGTEMYAEQIMKPLLGKLLQLWGNIPDFLLPLQAELSRSSFEEKAYMNFDFNLEKIEAWIDEAIRCPLLSGDCYWIWMDGLKYPSVYFSEHTPVSDMLFSIFVLFLVFMTIMYWKTGKSMKLFVAIGCAYAFNLVLHFIYGAKEAFMYTPHYLFLLIILYGLASNVMKEAWAKLNLLFLFVLFCFEIIVNMSVYNNIRLFLVDYLSTPDYSMVLLAVWIVLAMSSIYYVLLKWYNYKKTFIEDCMEYMGTIESAYNGILIYATICFLYMIFAFSASFIK